MNKVEGMIMVRDHILANIFEIVIGEGSGKAYKQAVAEADGQLTAALKGTGGG